MKRIASHLGAMALVMLSCGVDSLRRLPTNPPAETTNTPTDDDTEDTIPDPPEGINDPPPTCQTGALMGRLCMPGQDTPLSGAHVYLNAADCNGNVKYFETYAADNGQFSLAGLPEGTHTIYVEASGDYDPSFTATVVAGEINVAETSNPDAPICLTEAPPRLAVVTGSFDSVQDVLDGLELTYDLYDDYCDSWGGGSGACADDLLDDLDKLLEYDVVFFNCGTGAIPYDYDDAKFENLRTFLGHGGSIYASDWAWNAAEGLNEAAIDWYGDEDGGTSSPQVGQSGGVSGQIEDPELKLFIGSPSVAVDFDLGAWVVIDDVAPQTKVFVRGDVQISDWMGGVDATTLQDRPLLVGFAPYGASGGYVLYTSFHYHAQPTAQMLDVLRYLIFQL